MVFDGSECPETIIHSNLYLYSTFNTLASRLSEQLLFSILGLCAPSRNRYTVIIR